MGRPPGDARLAPTRNVRDCPSGSVRTMGCVPTSSFGLSTNIVFLAGIYFSLFVLALWATRDRRDVVHRRLRCMTLLLYVLLLHLTFVISHNNHRFGDLCVHLIVRSLQFSRSRAKEPDESEFLRWTIPLMVIGK